MLRCSRESADTGRDVRFLQAITAEDRWLRADPSSLQRNVGSDISAELKEAWAKVS